MLVVDDTQGLIVSAMLERMGGYGQLVAVHEGDFHNYDILRYMNFSKDILDTLYTVPAAYVDPELPNGTLNSFTYISLIRLFCRPFWNIDRWTIWSIRQRRPKILYST